MAEFIVTPERREAGQRYIDALANLGFHPDMALWVKDTEADEYRLMLVTDMVRLAGPAQIYELLHTAYVRAATPADFEPWWVEVIDRSHQLVVDFERALDSTQPAITVDFITTDGQEHKGVRPDPIFNFRTLAFAESWVYFRRSQKRVSAAQQLKHLVRNVERLAA